jgi:hypothetical protein
MAMTRRNPPKRRWRDVVSAALVFSLAARHRATSEGAAAQSKEQRSDAQEQERLAAAAREGGAGAAPWEYICRATA